MFYIVDVGSIAYAAADAVHTLWVADAIRDEIEAARLEEICRIEQAARPFLDQMERTGLPFDWDGWRTELEGVEAALAEIEPAAEALLAEEESFRAERAKVLDRCRRGRLHRARRGELQPPSTLPRA